MINKKGQLFGKINIFDFIALILIFLLVFGGGYKLLAINIETAENTVEITYDLFIQSVRDATVDAFSVGGAVYDFNLKEKIGYITGVKKEPAKRYLENLDGSVSEVLAENRYDVTVSVKTEAVRVKGMLTIGKAKIIDGLNVQINTQKANCIADVKNLIMKE
jgi:hypothetical protein